MDALINFGHSLWTLFIAAGQALFEIAQCVWSNAELCQWICDEIADSPLVIYVIAAFVITGLGGLALTKREQRQIRHAAEFFCDARDFTRWLRRK